MSEQYKCNKCGYVFDMSDMMCSECGDGFLEPLRWTKGGDGSHWEGCEDVHWDCRIAQLEAELAALHEQVRWIPVSERLPEMLEWVLVAYNGVVSVGRNTHQYGWEPIPVTHWMPLPKLPEESENE